ncbi:uncharacterized protein PAC_03870 [Phialocephala subalpina]|uniref:Uncharacterized protein n=1 Tax=Phialocephala subalpina TaxID=576137 RepID=A0A1L7WMJ2_9HELO|nr:uncharacterized protein PAC_03870 [Phialocephala subalpina]
MPLQSSWNYQHLRRHALIHDARSQPWSPQRPPQVRFIARTLSPSPVVSQLQHLAAKHPLAPTINLLRRDISPALCTEHTAASIPEHNYNDPPIC